MSYGKSLVSYDIGNMKANVEVTASAQVMWNRNSTEIIDKEKKKKSIS